jgi:hypothetical protein
MATGLAIMSLLRGNPPAILTDDIVPGRRRRMIFRCAEWFRYDSFIE